MLAALALLPVVATASPAAAREARRADIAAAVAAPGRDAEAVVLDAGRHPVEILTFEGLKPGMVAADIMAGSGYYSEIMARVAGPKGRVDAYEPSQFAADPKAKAAWDALQARNPNLRFVTYRFEAFAAPASSYDFVMLHLSYHDLYWESAKYGVPRTDPQAFLAALYRATRPGGTVAVIDHVAAPGDTRASVEKTHRIDPAVVKADFKAAGFVLAGESDMLRVPADDHAKLVFDPAVRGKTDRMVLRFVKPRR